MSVKDDADLVAEFDVDEVIGPQPAPSWNVAPTAERRIVVERESRAEDHQGEITHQLHTARWGLVPNWAKDARGGARMINARIETVTSKPAFKRAAARRRCLVPAEGYYEWQQRDGGKIPYFLHELDGSPLAMAGLYELWRDEGKADDDPTRWLWTYTIITQAATDRLGEIHDRSPVLVPADLREAWLDCADDDAGTAEKILRRVPPANLEPTRVAKAVGSVKNDGPELIEPVDAADDNPSDAAVEAGQEAGQQVLDL